MVVRVIDSVEKFQEVVKNNNGKPALVDFWADWCGPCKSIAPLFEKYSELQETSSVDFFKVNTDEQSSILQQAGIQALPTVVLYKGGEKSGVVVGANTPALHDLVARAIQ
ncbi:hypothetical protein AX17_000606 [Amanita inopinata Kibby_2008]|nr:hypothetical protein AX17_000606 [Amanita inopinata Kibby_2008]